MAISLGTQCRISLAVALQVGVVAVIEAGMSVLAFNIGSTMWLGWVFGVLTLIFATGSILLLINWRRLRRRLGAELSAES